MLLLCALVAPALTSCGDDKDSKDPNEPDAPDLESIVGIWEYWDYYSDEDNDTEFKMVLTFNNDHTGSISESWVFRSRASTNRTYNMKFSWTTTSDSYGNDIMRISYVSGDKDTELFNGGQNTVLWSRQYVLTGTILNVYQGDGVWVFNRK